MTDPAGVSPSPDAPQPKWKPLNSRQRRVLGVLIEKAKTTPDVYPMTVNGIVTGANQKSNREPQMSLTADDVEQVLEELRAMGAVTEVQGSGRVAKYRHHAYEWLGVDKVESAIMTELLLRGEQTLGELRGRAARMEPIADQATLKPIVDGLIRKGLMLELSPAGRGQVVSHNLYKERELVELRARFAGHVPVAAGHEEDEEAPAQQVAAAHLAPPAMPPMPASHPPFQPLAPTPPAPAASSVTAGGVTADMLTELEVELAELRAEFARLRERVEELEELVKG